MLIRAAEVDGVPGVELRLRGGRIAEIGSLSRRSGEPVVDAGGGALIPGLHDHHVHLRAWAAARASLDLRAVPDADGFDRAVRKAAGALPPDAWLRGVGWHESTAGPVDRGRLDALTGDRPARLQHRTGALWVLNSAALGRVGSTEEPGFERNERGEPTGRLWRLDGWLRSRIPPATGDLPALAAAALARGVTGFTDATPDRDQADVDALAALALPQRLVLMAPPGLRARPGVELGPHKLILDDDRLPSVEQLGTVLSASHRRGTAVAIHCVTAEQLIVAAAAIEQAGPLPGDRIEHGGVVPPGFAARLAGLGVAVVTNPGFLAERGDSYRREVAPAEQDWLYPCRSLRAAGVPVAAATDAPFGPDDPWVTIRAAIERRTESGHPLNPNERVRPAEALALFLADPQNLRRTRKVAVGEPADLCLLRAPLSTVLAEPEASWVRTTLVSGRSADADR